jgi:hypothetical protein
MVLRRHNAFKNQGVRKDALQELAEMHLNQVGQFFELEKTNLTMRHESNKAQANLIFITVLGAYVPLVAAKASHLSRVAVLIHA